ncbi:glycosyltransferase family 9 protein [bacterium]|nr:glycosyltransferase family 9 protein [candidate division CSSED10-310 bacterium]
MDDHITELQSRSGPDGKPGTPRVMIIKLSAVGDVIHALPVLARLKSRIPSPRICWVVEAKAAAILVDNPLLDELVVIDTHRWRRSLLRPAHLAPLASLILRFAVHLRRWRADEVYDLQGLLKSGVLAWLSGAKRRIGFHRRLCREPINHRFTNEHRGPGITDAKHVVDLNLSLVEGGGGEVTESDFTIAVGSADRDSIDRFLLDTFAGEDFLVAVNPGAGWSTKRWPVQHFAALCRELTKHCKVRCLALWGPGEEDLAAALVSAADNSVALAPPTNLKQLYYLISRCDMFISGDTGPLHLAAAAGCPSLALFGPSDPRRNGPYGMRHTVIWKKPHCAPCYKRTCESQAECIESIPVNLVVERAAALITSIRGDRIHPAWVELS